MDDLLKEAIADAKAVRETALENAKIALEEAFTPRLQSMLSKKIQSEMEDDEDMEDKDPEEAMYDEDEDMEDKDPEETMHNEERPMNDDDEDPSDDHSDKEEDMLKLPRDPEFETLEAKFGKGLRGVLRRDVKR